MQPADHIPDWVARLGAEPYDATPAEWSRWRADVTTYYLTFEALGPKRTAQERRDNWHDDYGKVILRPRAKVERSVPEIEVVEAFRASGWVARLQDSFGSAPAWMRPWMQVADVPRTVSECLGAIRAASPLARPWDVLAWRADDVMFVECKAAKEKFTDAEQAFIWGAHKVGIPLERLAVVRDAIAYPERSSE
jgi:hypothetical protein